MMFFLLLSYNFAPHMLQNLAVALFCALQDGQCFVAIARFLGVGGAAGGCTPAPEGGVFGGVGFAGCCGVAGGGGGCCLAKISASTSARGRKYPSTTFFWVIVLIRA